MERSSDKIQRVCEMLLKPHAHFSDSLVLTRMLRRRYHMESRTETFSNYALVRRCSVLTIIGRIAISQRHSVEGKDSRTSVENSLQVLMCETTVKAKGVV
jgi:hypothetical protein